MRQQMLQQYLNAPESTPLRQLEETLFDSNTRLVYHVYKVKMDSFAYNARYKEDLIQEGMLALWRCCTRFDPSKGIEFCTYAFRSIYLGMMRKAHKLTEQEKYITLVDVIPEQPYSPEDEDNHRILLNLISKEDPRTQDVIRQYLDGVPQVDIARQYQVTQSYISRTIKRFAQKARQILNPKGE